MSDPSSNWSLKREIQKRKTQQVLRAITAKQVQTPLPLTLSRTTQEVPFSPRPRTLPKRIGQTAQENKRTAQGVRMVSPVARWTKRQRQIAIFAAILVIAVCMATTVVGTRQPALQIAPPPLPTTEVSSLVSYLKEVGVSVDGVRRFTVLNAMWSAKEEIQFEVHRWDGKGVFVVLSYNSSAQAGIDAFKATYDQKFGKWTLIQISNLLVLSSPNTVQLIRTEIASHLTQYLVSPYRSFIPTETPQPTPDREPGQS